MLKGHEGCPKKFSKFIDIRDLRPQLAVFPPFWVRSIEKNFIGNNVLAHKPMNFKGILNRSNFSKNHYDLTPAFDFEKLTKLINN